MLIIVIGVTLLLMHQRGIQISNLLCLHIVSSMRRNRKLVM